MREESKVSTEEYKKLAESISSIIKKGRKTKAREILLEEVSGERSLSKRVRSLKEQLSRVDEKEKNDSFSSSN
jgi:hypothetical protein